MKTFNVACIEEIAYRNGYIGKDQLLKLAEPLEKVDYGKCLISLINENEVLI